MPPPERRPAGQQPGTPESPSEKPISAAQARGRLGAFVNSFIDARARLSFQADQVRNRYLSPSQSQLEPHRQPDQQRLLQGVNALYGSDIQNVDQIGIVIDQALSDPEQRARIFNRLQGEARQSTRQSSMVGFTDQVRLLNIALQLGLGGIRPHPTPEQAAEIEPIKQLEKYEQALAYNRGRAMDTAAAGGIGVGGGGALTLPIMFLAEGRLLAAGAALAVEGAATAEAVRRQRRRTRRRREQASESGIHDLKPGQPATEAHLRHDDALSAPAWYADTIEMLAEAVPEQAREATPERRRRGQGRSATNGDVPVHTDGRGNGQNPERLVAEIDGEGDDNVAAALARGMEAAAAKESVPETPLSQLPDHVKDRIAAAVHRYINAGAMDFIIGEGPESMVQELADQRDRMSGALTVLALIGRLDAETGNRIHTVQETAEPDDFLIINTVIAAATDLGPAVRIAQAQVTATPGVPNAGGEGLEPLKTDVVTKLQRRGMPVVEVPLHPPTGNAPERQTAADPQAAVAETRQTLKDLAVISLILNGEEEINPKAVAREVDRVRNVLAGARTGIAAATDIFTEILLAERPDTPADQAEEQVANTIKYLYSRLTGVGMDQLNDPAVTLVETILRDPMKVLKAISAQFPLGRDAETDKAIDVLKMHFMRLVEMTHGTDQTTIVERALTASLQLEGGTRGAPKDDLAYLETLGNKEWFAYTEKRHKRTIPDSHSGQVDAWEFDGTWIALHHDSIRISTGPNSAISDALPFSDVDMVILRDTRQVVLVRKDERGEVTDIVACVNMDDGAVQVGDGLKIRPTQNLKVPLKYVDRAGLAPNGSTNGQEEEQTTFDRLFRVPTQGQPEEVPVEAEAAPAEAAGVAVQTLVEEVVEFEPPYRNSSLRAYRRLFEEGHEPRTKLMRSLNEKGWYKLLKKATGIDYLNHFYSVPQLAEGDLDSPYDDPTWREFLLGNIRRDASEAWHEIKVLFGQEPGKKQGAATLLDLAEYLVDPFQTSTDRRNRVELPTYNNFDMALPPGIGVALVGPPEGGKTVVLKRMIERYQGSALIVSSKPDLLDIIDTRLQYGYVEIFAPFGLGKRNEALLEKYRQYIKSWSPLGRIKNYGDAQEVSKIMEESSQTTDGQANTRTANDQHWQSQGRSGFASVLYKVVSEGRTLDDAIRDVYKMDNVDTLKQFVRDYDNLIKAAEGRGDNDEARRLSYGRDAMIALRDMDERPRSSVIGTMRTILETYEREELRLITRTSEIDPSRLARERGTIILVGNAQDFKNAGPAFGSIIGEVTRAIRENQELDPETTRHKSPPVHTGIFIDEIANLPADPNLLGDAAESRQGFPRVIGAQSLYQVIQKYGEHAIELLTSTTDLVIFPGAGPGNVEYVQKKVGSIWTKDREKEHSWVRRTRAIPIVVHVAGSVMGWVGLDGAKDGLHKIADNSFSTRRDMRKDRGARVEREHQKVDQDYVNNRLEPDEVLLVTRKGKLAKLKRKAYFEDRAATKVRERRRVKRDESGPPSRDDGRRRTAERGQQPVTASVAGGTGKHDSRDGSIEQEGFTVTLDFDGALTVTDRAGNTYAVPTTLVEPDRQERPATKAEMGDEGRDGSRGGDSR